MARTLRAPDGRVWRVGRDWPTHFKAPRLKLPRRRDRRDGSCLDILNFGDFGGFDDIAGVIGGLVVMIVLTVVLLFIGAPLLVFALQGLVFLAATGWGLVLRQIGRRPWTVVVRSNGSPPEEATFRVVGWRASGRLVAEIARRLKAGRPLDDLARPSASPHRRA